MPLAFALRFDISVQVPLSLERQSAVSRAGGALPGSAGPTGS